MKWYIYDPNDKDLPYMGRNTKWLGEFDGTLTTHEDIIPFKTKKDALHYLHDTSGLYLDDDYFIVVNELKLIALML
jgi:hypothetical protein